MGIITLKVSEEEERFLKSMAKLENKPLSELIKEKALKSLEDEYDSRVADMRLEEYENYLASGGKILKWENLKYLRKF